MNKLFLKYGLLSLALVLFAACNNEDITPDTPDTPAEGYRWTFGGGVGTGDATRAGHWTDAGPYLKFWWNYNTEDEVVFAIKNNTNFIQPLKQDDKNNPVHHYYMRVLPHDTRDEHWALFETMAFFAEDQSTLGGNTLYAVTPVMPDKNGSTATSSAKSFSATLNMPGTFQQETSIKPEYLHPYMYMYATATLNESGDASLTFRHIPATLRFKVRNCFTESFTISDVKITVKDADGDIKPFAPKTATLKTDENGDYPTMSVEYSVDCHDNISIKVTPTTISPPRQYLAYALVFPGVEIAPTDQIIITATIIDDKQQTLAPTLALTGDKFQQVTGSNQFISGDLYTFTLKWNGTLTVGDVTVEPWKGVEILAPDATEIENPNQEQE